MRDALFGAEEKEPEIAVSPRMLRPWEAKILFVKEGSLPKGTYSNPKPHDHRGVSVLSGTKPFDLKTNYLNQQEVLCMIINFFDRNQL